VDLTDAAPMKTITGRRRKPVGLRIHYGISQGVSRVDITVEFHNAAEHFPPTMEMPEWMRRIVEANRPADVDNPDEDRRTGMGGWPLPAPMVELADDDGTSGICWCGEEKQPGANHSLCYPGME
jgi:hypothetical protein